MLEKQVWQIFTELTLRFHFLTKAYPNKPVLIILALYSWKTHTNTWRKKESDIWKCSKKLRQEAISTRKMVVVFKCPGSLFANIALLSRRAEAQANKSKNYINQEKKKIQWSPWVHNPELSWSLGALKQEHSQPCPTCCLPSQVAGLLFWMERHSV